MTKGWRAAGIAAGAAALIAGAMGTPSEAKAQECGVDRNGFAFECPRETCARTAGEAVRTLAWETASFRRDLRFLHVGEAAAVARPGFRLPGTATVCSAPVVNTVTGRDTLFWRVDVVPEANHREMIRVAMGPGALSSLRDGG